MTLTLSRRNDSSIHRGSTIAYDVSLDDVLQRFRRLHALNFRPLLHERGSLRPAAPFVVRPCRFGATWVRSPMSNFHAVPASLRAASHWRSYRYESATAPRATTQP